MTEQDIEAPAIRALSLISAAARMTIGIGLLAAPEVSLRALGFSDVSASTVAIARVAGIRDFVLGGVTLGALNDRERLLGATVANATADTGDAAAFALAARSGETAAGLRGMAAAIPAALAGIWVARRLG